MQKTCFKCNCTLDISEFYKHSRMADGHLGKCKNCTRRDVSQNRSEKREYYSLYERDRCKQPERHQYKIEQERKHRQANPQKYKARQMVGNAIRDGKVLRQPCQLCGNPKSQAHHEDYGKPFDVVWACFKCHREKFHGQVVVSDYDQSIA